MKKAWDLVGTSEQDWGSSCTVGNSSKGLRQDQRNLIPSFAIAPFTNLSPVLFPSESLFLLLRIIVMMNNNYYL